MMEGRNGESRGHVRTHPPGKQRGSRRTATTPEPLQPTGRFGERRADSDRHAGGRAAASRPAADNGRHSPEAGTPRRGRRAPVEHPGAKPARRTVVDLCGPDASGTAAACRRRGTWREKGLAIFPNALELRKIAGEAAAANGRHAEAVRHFEEAVRIAGGGRIRKRGGTRGPSFDARGPCTRAWATTCRPGLRTKPPCST